MSLKLRPGHHVFVFSEYIDMRAGFDRLSMLIRERMKTKLVDGDLFIFLGKNRKRLKGLCYNGTGLILIAKRLEQGRFMRLEELEFHELTGEELDWLLRGSVVKRAKFGEEALTRAQSSLNLSRTDGAPGAGQSPSALSATTDTSTFTTTMEI